MQLLKFVCLFSAVTGHLFAQAGRDLAIQRVNRSPLEATGKRWALIVGISSYKNAPPQAQLRFAHRDAEDFAAFLRSPGGGGIPASQIRVLTEQQATLGSIRGALHNWLARVSGPNDIVYIFFAGHGVVAERNEGYFVAHDSDPQNLHSTGLGFREVNTALTSRLKAALVVMLADACHAGSIGWTADPSSRSRAHEALEGIGAKDRSFLKLLASRPSERSFEDARWDGGHGVFTYALLGGLRGRAEQDRDGIVRVSELIEYIAKVVPQETNSQQNPRVAGNFEARLPLALSTTVEPAQPGVLSLDVAGPAGASVYLDRVYRGRVRSSGDLRVDNVAPGEHALEVEMADGRAFEHVIAVTRTQTRLDLDKLPQFAIMQLESSIRRGVVLQPNGAWDMYNALRLPPEQQPAADSLIASALEDIGQQCVNDYVQSTSVALKARMLNEAAEAYARLRRLRPDDRALEAKRTFCEGRALIATGRFAEAETSLKASIQIDPDFSCAYNALGVALGRQGRGGEARAAFEKAFQLTPEWFLPALQMAQQHITAGQADKAVPLLEKAVQFSPQSAAAQWTLLRLLRVLNRDAAFETRAAVVAQAFPNYAPMYLEIAAFREARGDYPAAVRAYDAYLTLAPNFEDSVAIRSKADRARSVAQRKVPTLRR